MITLLLTAFVFWKRYSEYLLQREGMAVICDQAFVCVNISVLQKLKIAVFGGHNVIDLIGICIEIEHDERVDRLQAGVLHILADLFAAALAASIPGNQDDKGAVM